MIPAFSQDGLLPPGIHVATEHDLRARFAGSNARAQVFKGVEYAVAALRLAGCKRLWIDGSFATAKATPGDWDGCWDPVGVDPLRLDPVLADFSPQGRARMKIKYLADLFPSTFIESSTSSTFLQYFQVDKRTGLPKGVVQLNLGNKP